MLWWWLGTLGAVASLMWPMVAAIVRLRVRRRMLTRARVEMGWFYQHRESRSGLRGSGRHAATEPDAPRARGDGTAAAS